MPEFGYTRLIEFNAGAVEPSLSAPAVYQAKAGRRRPPIPDGSIAQREACPVDLYQTCQVAVLSAPLPVSGRFFKAGA